ncbi:MAG: RNA methyltransferase [Treponema sp.]|jgi:tRNA/rRNA methyltransferase/tRNA (cytidine32/uridine32-2'-O)-methyltransferase|nr:RNA methyltransferase [Treponema sp.]
MKLHEISVILCGPSDPGNIGAVCRAMMNMGLTQLRITGRSGADFAPFEGEIRSRAVHAAGIWERARFFPSLREAAADCAVLVGTTHRRGRKRKNVTMDCRELALWLRDRPGQAALAFGNERSGLDNTELGLCNIASHIPVSPSFPSLNLSHAVQIYCHELFRALEPGETGQGTNQGTGQEGERVKGAWEPLNRDQADTLAVSIAENLESLGFYRQPGKEEQVRFIRDFISRAALSQREGNYLGDIFAKAARLALGVCRASRVKPKKSPNGYHL